MEEYINADDGDLIVKMVRGMAVVFQVKVVGYGLFSRQVRVFEVGGDRSDDRWADIKEFKLFKKAAGKGKKATLTGTAPPLLLAMELSLTFSRLVDKSGASRPDFTLESAHKLCRFHSEIRPGRAAVPIIFHPSEFTVAGPL